MPEFPEEWQEIASTLQERPDPLTRNWLHGETVEDLERENEEHGRLDNP